MRLEDRQEPYTGYTIQYIYGVDGIIGFHIGDIYYYYQKNLQGDVVELIRYVPSHDDKQLIATYVYDAWGNHKVLNPDGTENTDSSFIGNKNPIRYRSYYYDVETGLYYLKTRYYDPRTGRFISPDSADYLDPSMISGMNLYAYCLNNPVMYSDEFGQMPEWAKWIVGGLAVAGLVVATVLTCGVAGAGAATVGAAMLTGGIVSGGINAIDQLSDGVEFDFMELAIATLSGTAYGAVIGLTGGSGVWAVTGKFAVAGGTSLLNSWNDNAEIGETIKSLGVNLLFSGIAQGAGYLAGKYAPQLMSKIIPKNPNHLLTMGDIGSVLWNIPAVKTGGIRLVSGIFGSIINDF